MSALQDHIEALKGLLGAEGSVEERLKTLERVEAGARALAQQLDDERTRHELELKTIRREVHDELIDREANAARIIDRQRTLFERSGLDGQLSAHERAIASANFVESAIAALCPNPPAHSADCELVRANSCVGSLE